MSPPSCARTWSRASPARCASSRWAPCRPALPAPAADAAAGRLATAEELVRDARAALSRAGQSAARAEADLAAAADRFPAPARSLGLLAGPLAGVPDGPAPLPGAAEVAAHGDAVNAGAAWGDLDDELLARASAEVGALAKARDDLDAAAERAAGDAQAARHRQRAAAELARQTEAGLAAARAAFRAARDPLVALGAPPVEDAGLADGWATLTRWAREQAQARAAALDEARSAAGESAGRPRALAEDFGRQERELASLRAAAGAAHGAQQRAQATFDQVTTRVAELDEALRGAPDDDAITARLAELTRLEGAAANAERSLSAARAGRAAGERSAAELQRAESAARGADALPGTPSSRWPRPCSRAAGCCRTGVTWSAGRLGRRARARPRSPRRTRRPARPGLAWPSLAGEVSADLADAGISLTAQSPAPSGGLAAESAIPERVAAAAAPAVAAAAERARSAIARIAERRDEAAALAGRQQRYVGERQVAGLVGDLLRANQFQRWLVTETLDDLVAEASSTLRRCPAASSTSPTTTATSTWWTTPTPTPAARCAPCRAGKRSRRRSPSPWPSPRRSPRWPRRARPGLTRSSSMRASAPSTRKPWRWSRPP